MLRLPEVTLIAFGTTNKAGMVRALAKSCEGIEWGDVRLVDSVPCNGIDEWNKNIIYHLTDYVDTPFCVLIHPDGYVVNPEMWDDDWLNYDYIGAPWPLPTDDYSYRTPTGEIVRVGNSVSLRSKKILDLPKKLMLPWQAYYGNTNEDGFLTCHNRDALEANGVKFAPIEVAKWFSKEIDIPENQDVEKPFCFHYNRVKPGRNVQYAPLIEKDIS